MSNESKQTVARVLTLSLGATTAMWVFSYIALLFSGMGGGEILFVAAGLCLPIAARHAVCLKEGAWVGFVSALLNALLIGSIVGGTAPNEMMFAALYWTAGLFVASIILGVIGAALHGKLVHCTCCNDWKFGFIAVAATLVFVMLVTGGLVTGMEAGLAVPDWPNSYGHNMLLYPLTEMVSAENEGVFFEHAHRLTGMFVGLTSIIMLVCVWKWSTNTWARVLATTIFLFVCVQGLLGGLRVTGYLTLAQDPAVLSPNLWIGVVHGVVGQLIFAGFVWLAAMMSPSWATQTHVSNKKDCRYAWLLVVSMVLQLVLGAVYRHMMGDSDLAPKATHILYTHIAIALLVFAFAAIVGMRFINRDSPILKKCGIIVMVLVGIQLLLGGGALIVVLLQDGTDIPLYEVLLTTAHQANGALLLGASFLALAWVRRMMSV